MYILFLKREKLWFYMINPLPFTKHCITFWSSICACCQLLFVFKLIQNIYIPTLFWHEPTKEDEITELQYPKSI